MSAAIRPLTACLPGQTRLRIPCLAAPQEIHQENGASEFAGKSTIGEPASSIELTSFAGEHLFYEAQMFLAAREALRLARSQSFEMNTRIEVCVVHFRNLVDFFYLAKPKVDDVVAAHYVPDWERQRPALSTPLEKARSRANKEMAHLTTRRIAGSVPEKAWDFNALSTEMRPVIKSFLNLVALGKVPQNTIAELSKI